MKALNPGKYVLVLQHGADVDDGVHCMGGLVAISHSIVSGKPVRLADVSGGVHALVDMLL